MKKLLLIALLLFSVQIVSAQSSFYQTYKVVSGKWNEYLKEYVYSEPNYESIRLEFNKNVIRVYDREGSVYITRNQRILADNDKIKMYAWDAIDEGNRNCRITMAYKPGDTQASLSVLYSDVIYEYTYFLSKLK